MKLMKAMAVIVALAALPACAKPVDKVDALIKVMRDGKASYTTRAHAAEALGEKGDRRAVDPLIATLSAKESYLREKAILALGQLKDPRAVEPIFRSLVKLVEANPVMSSDGNEDDEYLRGLGVLASLGVPSLDLCLSIMKTGKTAEKGIAMMVLSQIKDVRAAQALFEATRDPDPDASRAAVLLLGHSPTPDLATPLIAALKDGDVRVRMSAVAVAANSDTTDIRLAEPLLEVASSSDSGARLPAAVALARIAPEKAVIPLLELISDPDKRVSCIAALYTVLSRLKGAPRGSAIEKTKKRDGIIGILVDAVAEVGFGSDEGTGAEPSGSAAGVLALIRDDRPVIPLIAILTGEYKPSTASVVPPGATSLTREEGSTTVTIDLNEQRAGVKRDAAFALGEIGDPRAVTALIAALSSKDRDLPYTAAEALGKIGDPRAVPALTPLLKRQRVCYAALRAIAQIEKQKAVPTLIAVVTDPKSDMPLRTDAIDYLVALRDPRAVAPLLRALEDKDEEVRSSAACALVGFADKRVVSALANKLGDESWLVRTNVAAALTAIGNPEADKALMDALSKRDLQITRGAAEFYIRKGVDRAIPLLKKALLEPPCSDSPELADIYLHSGNQELVSYTKKRAAEIADCGTFTPDPDAHYCKWGEQKR